MIVTYLSTLLKLFDTRFLIFKVIRRPVKIINISYSLAKLRLKNVETGTVLSRDLLPTSQ
jgi:hypothetical protein